MEKSEKGKEVSTSILESGIAPSLTDVLDTQSKSELPQDPTNGSLGSEFPALSHPSNTTSVPSSSSTNTNAGASSSNISQELTLFSRTRFGASTQTNAGALSSNTNQETQIAASSSNAGTHTNAGASSTNTSQEPQMAASTSNAGTSGDSGAGDVGVNDSGIAVGANIGDHPLAPMYTLIDTIKQETGYIRSMAALHNWVLFTGSDNSLVRMWRKGHAVEHFSSSSGPINAMLFQDPEARIFCAHDDGAITVWEKDITGGVFKRIKRLQTVSDFLQKSISFTHDKAVSCLCLSGDGGEFIYSGSKDHTVKVWRIRGSGTWKLVETIPDHKGPIYALATQDRVLSSASSDGTMKLWIRELYGKKEDKVRHKLKRTCVFSGAVVNAINLGVDDFIYVGLSDGKVMSWSLYTMLITEDDKPEVMSIHKAAVTCLASLRFGPFVFSGSVDMTICVWRRQLVGQESFGPLHTLVMVLKGHSGPIRCIETDYDWEADATGARGRWIVYSASTDGALKVWRVYDRPMPRQYVHKSEHRLQVELRRLRSI